MENTRAQQPADMAGATAAATVFREGLPDVDPAVLSDQERLALVAELGRVAAAASAAQARLTAAFAAGQGIPTDTAVEGSDAWRPVGSQVGLARRVSPSRGDRWVRHSLVLVNDLPHTLAALERGDISEEVAVCVAEEAAVLDRARRRELDERLAEILPDLSVRATRRAAQRIAAEIDAEAVERRMRRAQARRRVTMRPVGDGMAYLSILGTVTDIAGAYESVREHAEAVFAGQVEGETRRDASGLERSLGAIMSDTALARLSGRAASQAQPVAVNIVITDRALLGTGEQCLSADEPALVPGAGPMPADLARELLADPEVAAFFRRLYTSPNGRDLVAMDSVSRVFPTGLRTMIKLRDQQCRTRFCDAPISQIDHIDPHRAGGRTSYRQGQGLCIRCNLTKETPGYRSRVRGSPDERLPHRDDSGHTHDVETTTPSGQRATSLAPPLLGWGWQVPPEFTDAPARWPTRIDLSESVAEAALRVLLAA